MTEQDALILGALLHDIGKFEFRANRDFTPHTNYGGYFVGEHLKRFGCVEDIHKQIRRTVEWHHYAELADPSLQMADHTSAGSERTPDISTQTRRPLFSVLSGVNIGKGKCPDDVFYYPPGAINANTPFPDSRSDETELDEDEMVQLHADAWKAFLDDVQKLPDVSLKALIETFQTIIEKHTSRVASAGYKTVPDISLYDHSRSVAAFASCQATAGYDAKKPFLAIQGDVSGIQKFIYKLAAPDEGGGTKRTAKRLRGRSFYVWLLTETVANLYLQRLQLYRTNLIFSSGGHFLILAPNTESNRKICTELEKEINKWLYKSLKGDLGMVIATEAFDSEEVKDFAELISQMGRKVALEKRRKFRSVLDAQFFKPNSEPGKKDSCPVCQADFLRNADLICEKCVSHVELGQRIVSSNWLVRLEGQAPAGPWLEDFAEFDTYWALLEDADELYGLLNGLDPATVSHIVVYRLNDTNFLIDKLIKLVEDKGLSTTFGYRFLGNYAPQDSEGPKDFEELAKMDSEKYPLLGIVRMDVDSLGLVFQIGLEDRKSLSRLSTLSREMDLFFQGYINKLASEHGMYVTYSGGDDLFMVGSWVNALSFAQAVRKDFKQFSCDNPNLSISGGIFLCKEHFPINRAAELCATAEEAAKQHKGKDAVNAFGLTVNWQCFEELIELGEELYALCKNKELPRSLVHHLIASDQRCRTKDGKIDNAKLIQGQMRLKYLVARQGATQKKIDENASEAKPDAKIRMLAKLVMENQLMKNIRIPASYVLYKTRNITQND
ncbi:MAG: type III-A CRISPR-associated protein Cas10/Csm1 [Candidatus Latescibacteria bacterium]|nr:type III-A CRISPR-associated protein Cas10/Csm1 [Candidatus Latescibacterota bacterium]